MLIGTVPEGQSLELRFDGEILPLGPTAPETGLFANLDVILAQRHHESAEQVAEWFALHAVRHGANALLLMNRASPEEGFAEALAPLLDLGGLERLVVVQADLPFGTPNRPAIGAKALAPRTKDRRGKIDLWRAALGESALFEVLRWRFLALAAGVIALDPVEYLQTPDDGSNAFDAVKQSHSGVMPILGEAIYPWRVRKGEEPNYLDHICRAEPRVDAPNRWAAAPKRLGSGPVWMQNVVKGAQVIQDESLCFQRAMSLAFPQSDVAELVNKDVLVRDDALYQAARDMGAKPVQPPAKPKKTSLNLSQPASGRTVIVTCMKNEGPFILEWIAYHRMIGVDDFLVYTNDCDDGTDSLV